jgi:teichuronic acid biosynthesis glycosyltransferase TuaC
MHILTLSSLFPNRSQPVHGVFVRNRMEDFTRRFGHEWTVVAPVPWFPRLPFPVSPAYDRYARVPAREDERGYSVHHPRHFVMPKIGMRHYAGWMAMSLRKTIRDIHARKPIDVIDAHYLYPDGVAATLVGREMGIPVILSARGTDLNVFPSLPHIRPLLQKALSDCARLICVSSDLKRIALELGVPEGKTTVIGNGIDAERFRPRDRDECREVLALPKADRILLTVGHCVPGKGFDLAIRALGRLGRPDVRLVVAGDGPARPALEALADGLGLRAQVRFLGAVRNEDLPAWYGAADLFVLASAREGWPNVVCEAQAMGLPVVGTALPGLAEIVTDESLGILFADRTVEGLAEAMQQALSRPWGRESILRAGQARTWAAVSEKLAPVFTGAEKENARINS